MAVRLLNKTSLCFVLGFFVISSAVAAAEPLCVARSKAILRKGPGVKFPNTWTVSHNMPLLKVGEKGSWYEVRDLEGQTHWVISSAVTRKVSCAVIKSKTAKLRQGPGTRFPASELASAERYPPFKKLDRDGEWLLLEDDYRGQFWVHEKNVWLPMVRASLSF